MSGLAAIQASLRKLQNLGQAETEFDLPAFKMRLKIRLLFPAEEHVVHTIADAAPDETLPYLDTYHWECVSRVLMAVWIDGQAIFNFTDVTRMSQNHDREMIEVLVEEQDEATGKTVEKAQWMEKAALLKPVVRSWGRDILNIIFKKFRELSDEQTAKSRQGVEFKFNSIEDEIKVLEARIRVLKERLDNAAVVDKAVATFQNVVQRPLEEEEAVQVEESLDVRDDRSLRSQRPDPEPPTTAPVPPLESAPSPDPAPVMDEPPVLAPPPARRRPQVLTQDGQDIPVYHHDGGVLEEHEAPITAPPIDAPPSVGHNPHFTGGRHVRDRSQRKP
jgi:hypothetical protein